MYESYITVKTILGKTGINVSVIYPWIKSEFFYTPISFSGFTHNLSMLYPCFINVLAKMVFTVKVHLACSRD